MSRSTSRISRISRMSIPSLSKAKPRPKTACASQLFSLSGWQVKHQHTRTTRLPLRPWSFDHGAMHALQGEHLLFCQQSSVFVLESESKTKGKRKTMAFCSKNLACVDGTLRTVDRAESALKNRGWRLCQHGSGLYGLASLTAPVLEATAPVRPPETCRMSKWTVAPLQSSTQNVSQWISTIETMRRWHLLTMSATKFRRRRSNWAKFTRNWCNHSCAHCWTSHPSPYPHTRCFLNLRVLFTSNIFLVVFF